MNSRPRPIGSGRLSLWRLQQDIGLAPARAGTRTDSASVLVADGLDPDVERVPPSALMMAFGPIACFRIDFDKHTVSLIAAHPDADQETVDHLIDDHVAPRIIAAGGALVLHGSACAIDGKIAVFLGQTGSGKSTLAASLHAAGHRLLGDDAVIIEQVNGIVLGEPVYPSLRLYRESIDRVFAEGVATSAMAFYSDKRHVTADSVASTGPAQLPIGAVFILTEGEAGVTLDLVSPADACMAMVENSFALDPQDAAAAAQRMTQAARVASATACYELAYPYDFALLPEVRARVLASLADPDCSA